MPFRYFVKQLLLPPGLLLLLLVLAWWLRRSRPRLAACCFVLGAGGYVAKRFMDKNTAEQATKPTPPTAPVQQ